MSRDILVKLEELVSIGLLETLDLESKLDIETFNRVEERLLNIKSDSLELNGFYNNIFKLMGYNDIENPIKMANKLGIVVFDENNISNGDFIELVYSLLDAKTSSKIKLISKLAQQGVFDDYNKGKEIPERLIFNGQTQPIFNCEEAIFEKVYIETPLDTDEDGERDLILTFIRRPKETNSGMKAPIIYIANPYMMGGDDDAYILHDMNKDLNVVEQTHFSQADIDYRFDYIKSGIPKAREIKGQGVGQGVNKDIELEAITPWYDYLLSRGYAIVMAGGIGTRGSQGIRNCGGKEEVISTISVIDWLNHRLSAFSDMENNLEVKAFWSNGKVGMTGKSYLGTLAIGAATTGVEGLETIVPEAAISNWYDYYRKQGLLYSGMEWSGDDCDLLSSYCFSRVFDEDQKYMNEFFEEKQNKLRQEQDRVTGNYNSFWDERNYAKAGDNIKCSVFLVHGLKDWNVKPLQFDNIWRALENNNVSRKMLLHQGDHIYINDNDSIDFSQIMNKWYDHYLLGIENNIDEDQPNVMVQNNLDQYTWDSSQTWPFNKDFYNNFYVNSNGILNKGEKLNEEVIETIDDDITITGYNREEKNYTIWLENLVKQDEQGYKIIKTTDEIKGNLRISGTVKVNLSACCHSNTGVLSAMLVNYGKIEKSIPTIEEVENKFIELGKGAKALTSKKFKTVEEENSFEVITRGSINIQNKDGLLNKIDIKTGEFYDYEIEMEPMDYTVASGNKLGLIIYSTDPQFTVIPFSNTKFEINRNSIDLSIPY